MTSSRYTMTDLKLTDDRIISMDGCNDVGAFHKPSGILLNWYRQWCEKNAVLSFSDSLIST